MVLFLFFKIPTELTKWLIFLNIFFEIAPSLIPKARICVFLAFGFNGLKKRLQIVARLPCGRLYIRFMELIFKRPDGKLPFIGLLFESELQASRVNQNAVLRGKELDLKIDLLGSTVTLRLSGDDPQFYFMYTEPIKCDLKKLEAWRNNTAAPYNFGHVVRVNDRDRLVQTQEERKPFVVRIKKLYVEYEH